MVEIKKLRVLITMEPELEYLISDMQLSDAVC